MTYTENSVPINLNFKRWWVYWFWDENFKYNEENGCLEWIKSVNRMGYGRTSMNGIQYFAHRIAYALYYQEDPGDKLVMHLCDNPRCSNPFHLTLGTHDDNSKDMVRKGRSQTGDRHWSRRNLPEEIRAKWRAMGKAQAARMNGENHPATVLTADKVRKIKSRSANGESNKELAKAFGVTHSNISAIILGKSWGHIEVEPRSKDDKWSPKLTLDQVKEIRAKYDAGQSKASLAREFGMSEGAIFKVAKRISHKNVK